MNGQELCGQVCGVLLLLLLLLLLGQSVAVAPGDEDGRCPVPEYPVNVKVLMDSWRYHTLIAEGDGNGVWIATTTGQRRRMTPMEPITVASSKATNDATLTLFIYTYSGLLKELVMVVQSQCVLEVGNENGY